MLTNKRLYVSVGTCGADPLVLAHLRRDFARQRDLNIGQQRRQQITGPLLVRAVDVAVEKANGKTVHLRGSEKINCPEKVALVERQQNFAMHVHPFGNRESEPAGNQRLWEIDVEVVLFVSTLVADLECVTKSLSRDQCGPFPFALNQQIRSEGRTVDNHRDVTRLDASTV